MNESDYEFVSAPRYTDAASYRRWLEQNNKGDSAMNPAELERAVAAAFPNKAYANQWAAITSNPNYNAIPGYNSNAREGDSTNAPSTSGYINDPRGGITFQTQDELGKPISKYYPGGIDQMNEANTSGPGMLSELTTNFILPSLAMYAGVSGLGSLAGGASAAGSAGTAAGTAEGFGGASMLGDSATWGLGDAAGAGGFDLGVWGSTPTAGTAGGVDLGGGIWGGAADSLGGMPLAAGTAAAGTAGGLFGTGIPTSLVGQGLSAGANLLGGAMSSSAAKDAAQVQANATAAQIAAQKEALAQVRGDLQPFREAGVSQLPGLQRGISNLSELANDPNKQKSYIENNPFFKLLADDAQSRLFSNQAAKGKVGSGGTAQALQNSILLLGQDLLNQDFSRKNTALGNQFNLTTLGQNAAAMQGTATQNTQRSISDLATGGANAEAAGIVGSSNAIAGGINNAVNSGLTLHALNSLKL